MLEAMTEQLIVGPWIIKEIMRDLKKKIPAWLFSA